MKKDSTTGRLLNEVSEQLTFENLVTEEKETPEIIPILSGKFQPRKVEELLPDVDIIPDTYIIYPTGGYHPFHGVSNTPPKYQQKIWPYVKRIKFGEKYKSEEKLNKIRRGVLREGQKLTQINPYLVDGYAFINVERTERYKKRDHRTGKNGKGKEYMTNKKKIMRFHRLIALAWIPNPDNKPMVLHIDDDRTNYLINNLKWGTGKENQEGSMARRPDTMEQKYQDLINKGVIKG